MYLLRRRPVGTYVPTVFKRRPAGTNICVYQQCTQCLGKFQPEILRQRFSSLEKCRHTDKKENKIFLIFKEIQMGAVAKSDMRKGFLIYEEMHNYLVIYEEVVSHI
jgi:hypothetical protein